MEIPAAGFIESAREMLKNLDNKTRLDQLKELKEATGITGSDFAEGYMLGIQTARVLLATMPAAVQAGVNI